MDSKIHAYELTKGQKNHAYELMDQKIHACELTDQKNQAYKQRMRKSRADERVLVSECGKSVEFKSFPTVMEIACVKMQT